MRSPVIEFYKRFHGIENINEDMQLDIDCMESFLYTIIDTYDCAVKYYHDIELNSRISNSIKSNLTSGNKDNFKR